MASLAFQGSMLINNICLWRIFEHCNPTAGACYPSAYGLARKAVYDLIGYCHGYRLICYGPVVMPFTNPAFPTFQRCLLFSHDEQIYLIGA
jgi:hypothetical protein